MKVHLIIIYTHLLVPRSRSSAKVSAKYGSHIFKKMALSGGVIVNPKLNDTECFSPNTGPSGKVFVYKIQVNPIHIFIKYGNYYNFMDR